MFRVIGLRHQPLYVLADQYVAGIAKKAFQTGIHRDQSSARVDGRDAIDSRLEDRLVSSGVLPGFHFETMRFGGVLGDEEKRVGARMVDR